jgi:hypothetical protein
MLEIRRIADKDLSVPRHMSTLPQNVIDVIVKAVDACERIISCGIDPDDGCLYLVTATLAVRVIKPNGNLRPTSAFPAHDGRHIGLTLKDVETLQSVSSRLAIKNSEDCLESSTLSFGNNYAVDLHIKGVDGNNNETNTR